MFNRSTQPTDGQMSTEPSNLHHSTILFTLSEIGFPETP